MSEPTPPPPEPTAAADDSPSTAPAGRRGRRGLLVKVVAALVVLALVVGGGIAAALALGGPQTHSLTLPRTAGGMERDTEREKAGASTLEAIEKQVVGNVDQEVAYSRLGLYTQTDAKRGPEGLVLFVGLAFAEPVEDPATLLAPFRERSEDNGLKVTSLETGDDAVGACAEQPSTDDTVICAWATRDTFGQIFPTKTGYDRAQVAKLLLAVRADVERTD